MKPIETLFLSISEILGSRVTPENYRTKLDEIAAVRGIRSKDKTRIIIEILAMLIEITNEK